MGKKDKKKSSRVFNDELRPVQTTKLDQDILEQYHRKLRKDPSCQGFYMWAELHSEQAEYENAIQYYKLSQKNNTNDLGFTIQIYYGLGFSHSRLEQYGSSIKYFDKMLALRATPAFEDNHQYDFLFVDAYKFRGILAGIKELHNEAITFYNRGLEIINQSDLEKTHSTLYEVQGVAEVNLSASEPGYDLKIGLLGQRAKSYQALGNSQAAIADLHNAIETYSKAKNPDPQIAETLYSFLGHLYYEQQDYASSVVYSKKALQEIRKFPEVEPRILAISHLSYAHSLAMGENADESIAHSMEALNIYLTPQYNLSNYKEDIATVYKTIATAYLSKNDYLNTVEYCHKGLEIYLTLNPPKLVDTASMYRILGSCYFLQEQLNEALENYQTALKYMQQKQAITAGKPLNHHDANEIASINICIGNVYYKQEQFSEALTYFNAGLIAPQYQTIPNYVGRGTCYLKANELAKALQDYATVLKINNLDPNYYSHYKTIYINRGKIYSLQNNHQAAIENFDQALAYCEKNPDATVITDIAYFHSQRGLNYYKLKQYSAAITDGEIALDLYITHTAEKSLHVIIAKKNLGYAYTHIANYEKALEYINTTLEYYQAKNDSQKVTWLHTWLSAIQQAQEENTNKIIQRQHIGLSIAALKEQSMFATKPQSDDRLLSKPAAESEVREDSEPENRSVHACT